MMHSIPSSHPHTGLPRATLRYLSWLLLLVVAACGRPDVVAGSCSLTLPAAATDAEAIAAVLRAEGEQVVTQEIEALMVLWADGSYVANAKNTPEDAADDQYWRDKDAIRHRYVRTVFPGAAQGATPADLEIAVEGNRASVLATTQIGAERSPAGDRWTLVKVGDCWLIESLTYNLEAQP